MTSHARRSAWIAAGAAIVVAAVTGTVTAAQAHTPRPSLTWVDCGDGFECSTVSVPLDYDAHHSPQITVALTRLPATGARKGSVVVNAGTQSGGGGTLLRSFAPAFAGINRDFDIIGLDTRGVGASDPLVHCTTYEENHEFEAPLSAAQTVADRPQRLHEATLLAAECQERSGDILPYMSSTTSARDLDRVRAALGEQRLRFVGFSGGSILGQQYLAMFPERVAALVLDSPFDPQQYINDAFDFDVDQMVATERAMDTFFSWCASTPALCAFGDGDPRAAFEALLARTAQNRIDYPGRWDVVTDGALIDLISGAMLFPAQWPGFSQLLAAVAAQPVPMMPVPTGEDRGFAEYYSQSCLDREFPTSLYAYDRQLLASKRAAPYLGGRYGYAEFKCRQWPAQAAERSDGPWRNQRHRPVLVVAATVDPLAPQQGALGVSHRLDADLVLLRSTGHLQLGRTPCADDTVAAFLLTGRAPQHTVCGVSLPGN